MKLLRILALFLAALTSFGAFAQTATYWTLNHPNGGSTPPFGPSTDKAGLCSQYMQAFMTKNGLVQGQSYNFEIGGMPEVYRANWGAASGCGIYRITIANGYQDMINESSFIASSGPSCVAGAVTTVNITAGWMRGLSADQTYPELMPDGSKPEAGYMGQPPASMCINGCMQGRGAMGDSWVSTVPTAAGLYRVSDDWSFTSTASPCTQSTMEQHQTKSTQAPPACDGFTGSVNGKLVCAAKSGEPPYTPPPKATNTKAGNPTAGTTGGTTNIPTTGGNGGNAGGPKQSSDGGTFTPNGVLITPGTSTPPTGTKTATPGEEQLACGAPGQPKCSIEESGTKGTTTLALNEVDINNQANTNKTTITGNGDKGMFANWGSMFVTPAVVVCAPLTMPSIMGAASVSVNPCPVVDGVRTIMAWLWALAAFWVCLGWIREAV